VRPRPSLQHKPIQFQLCLDVNALQGLSAVARARAIAELANLLLLAADVRTKERDDDQRR